jgi:hypothetical protein
MRKQWSIYQLKPSRMRKVPQWFFLDIETWGLDPRPSAFAFGCISSLDGTKREIFHTAPSMRLWLEEQAKNGEVIVYAHNGHRYDYLSMFDAEEIATSSKVMVGTKLLELSVAGVKYRDSLAVLPMSVSKMGDAFNLPKGETPQAYMDAARRDITEQDIIYCWRDVDIIRAAMSSLWVEYHSWLGHPIDSIDDVVFALPLTGASMAYRVWSYRFWPAHWSWDDKKGRSRASCSAPERANDTLRLAYHGGRVQVLGTAGETVYSVRSVDRNSMYPSVMVESSMPDMDTVRECAPTASNLIKLAADDEQVYWANVELVAGPNAELFIPVTSEDGRKSYTQTRVSGWYVEPIIDYALAHGWQLKSVSELWFARSMKPFTDFVNEFYAIRLAYKKQGDGREILVKLLLNSLYGKFAQRNYAERIDDPAICAQMIEDNEWQDEFDLHFYGNIFSHLCFFIEKEASELSRNTWFGFAAFITGYAQVSLQQVISAAGAGALYCDTDSVHFKSDRWDDVVAAVSIGSELGDWDPEQPEPIPVAIYWEPKVYVHFSDTFEKTKVRHKGVPMSDGNLRRPQKVVQLTQWAAALRRGLEVGTPVHFEKRSKRWTKEGL